MTQNQKKVWGIVAGVAVFIGAVFLGAKAIRKYDFRNVSMDSKNVSLNDLAGNGPGASQATSTTSTPPTAGASNASAQQRYELAIAKYPYRIQFLNCKGTVNAAGIGTLVVKKGAQIMLDNRDAVSRTIAFKGQSYRIGPYDFAIAKAIYAGTYPVTCNGGGAAELKVEQ